jgi:hypothetical protein
MKSNEREDKPIGKLKIVADFLPSPDKLLPREGMVKITLSVDATTVQFFKAVAKRSKTKYQKMMREVLKLYAGRHRKTA